MYNMAANQTSNSLLKLNQFAKDLNMKTKDVTAILEEKGIAVKDGGYELLSPEIPEVCPEILF